MNDNPTQNRPEDRDFTDVTQQVEGAKSIPSEDFSNSLKQRLTSELFAQPVLPNAKSSRRGWAAKIAASLVLMLATATVGVAANEELRNGIMDQFDPKGSLEITSSDTVTISLDSKLIGQTPVSLGRVSTGAHIIKISRPDYEDFYQEVEVVEKKTSYVNISLDQLATYENEHTSYEVTLKAADSRMELTDSASFSDVAEKIAFIRQHYADIAAGNLEKTYAEWHQSVPFDVYQSWYADTQGMFIEKVDVVDASSFEIIVFEESSLTIVKYRVRMTLEKEGESYRIVASTVDVLATIQK